jgi:hypothetical protein
MVMTPSPKGPQVRVSLDRLAGGDSIPGHFPARPKADYQGKFKH